MKDQNLTKINLPQHKFTLASEKKFENNVNIKLRNSMKDIFVEDSNENEWAQEYYLIYNSHEMLYRNDA